MGHAIVVSMSAEAAIAVHAPAAGVRCADDDDSYHRGCWQRHAQDVAGSRHADVAGRRHAEYVVGRRHVEYVVGRRHAECAVGSQHAEQGAGEHVHGAGEHVHAPVARCRHSHET